MHRLEAKIGSPRHCELTAVSFPAAVSTPSGSVKQAESLHRGDHYGIRCRELRMRSFLSRRVARRVPRPGSSSEKAKSRFNIPSGPRRHSAKNFETGPAALLCQSFQKMRSKDSIPGPPATQTNGCSYLTSTFPDTTDLRYFSISSP